MEGNKALLDSLRTFGDSSEDSFSAHATSQIECAIAQAMKFPESTGRSGYYPRYDA